MTEDTPDVKTLKLLNNTIAEVTVEMEGMRPNTAIAKLIVLNNHLTSLPAVPRAAVGASDPHARTDRAAHLRGDVSSSGMTNPCPPSRGPSPTRSTSAMTPSPRGADQGQGACQA